MIHAIELQQPREAVHRVTRPGRPPGPGEVPVQLEACALGQLDWNLLTLDAPPRLPLTPGHEAVGTVQGRRVLLTPLAHGCGTCGACQRGEARFCVEVKWRGMHAEGLLCSEAVVEASSLVPIDAAFSPELACIGGSGWTAVGAVRALGLGAGARVGVFGIGGVGHLVLQVARAADLEVFADDVDPARLQVARALGAQVASVPLEGAVVCTPSMQALQKAVRAVRPGARVVFTGTSPAGRVDLPAADLTWKGLTLVSGLLGTTADLHEAIRLIHGGRVRPQVEVIRLSEVPSKLWDLRDLGFTGRLVVVPD